MVAYLEKTDGNTEFHQIMDFLTRSSIYYALTVSPIVSTSFVEQFWTTAKSRTVNNISYIDATVAGKPVTISEASIRSDLLFDDADGIDSLNNQAIFDNIQLMGYEGDLNTLTFNKALFSPQWKFLFHTMNHCISSKRKVTPLFDSMLVQQTEDEGDASERPSDSPPIPSPPHLSEDQPQIQPDLSPRPSPTTYFPDSIPEGSGGNHGGQSSNDASLSGNEDGSGQEAKERSQTTYHTSQRLDEDKIGKEDFSKEKGGTQGVVSTKAPVSTVKPNEGTDKKNEGSDKQDGSTDSIKVSTDRQGEGTADQNKGKSVTQIAPTTTSTPTPTIFGDDETITQVLITMSQNKQKEKEKGVKIRNVEDTKKPRHTSTRSILTLRPLPKIDSKDKGKKRIEEEDESDTESEGITKAEKKFKQLANDEEMARKVQEEWDVKEEKKRLAEEEATKVALTNEYDFIQARINADKILTEELQKEEREKFTIEQRAKFIHNTIAAQIKFLAQQRQDQNFIAIGSAEDERQIKEMNEESKDPEKDSTLEIAPEDIKLSLWGDLTDYDGNPQSERKINQGVLNSPCFIVKSWLVQDQTVLGGYVDCQSKKVYSEDRKEFGLQRKMIFSLDKLKIECYNCHRKGHFARECTGGQMSRGLRLGVSNDFEVEQVNYALMAISSSSSSSSSDSEEQKYSKQYKIVKEKDELKDKITKWEESTKNLDEILNSQMSVRDKIGLGYGTQLNELSSNHETHSENSLSVFYVRSSDEESIPANDMSSKADEYHVIPSPITRNFLTPRADTSFIGVLTRTGLHRPSVSTARPVCTARPGVSIARPVCTTRPSVCTARTSVSTARPVCTARPSACTARPMVDNDCSMNLIGTKLIFRTMKNSMEAFVLLEVIPKEGCFILSPSFKLLDESQVILRAPRKDDVYNLDLKNIVPSRGSLVIAWNSQPENSVAERKKYMTLIEAARTMLVDSLLPIPFWAEVNSPSIGFRPFGCPLTILNTLDSLGKFDGKSDEENQVNVDVDELKKMVTQELTAKAMDDVSRQAFEEEKRRIASQKKATQAISTNKLSTDRQSVSTDRQSYSHRCNAGESFLSFLEEKYLLIDASTLPNADLPIDLNMPDLEDDSDAFSNDGIFNGVYDDENVGAVADFNNIDDTINVSPIPTLRIHKNHLKDQILGDPKLVVQTRGKIQKASSAQQALVSYISKQNITNHKDHQNYLLACFLSQEEPNNISQALQDKSWVEAMQEELLQFKLLKVWILVDLPSGKKAIGTKLVEQGFKQEEGIDYDEVFAPVARIEAIRLFLAFASYMGFTVYQMDVKSAFLYDTIEEEVRGTIDKTLFIKKKKSDIMLVQVYVDDIIFGSTKKSMCTEFEDCMHKRFQISSMGELTFFLGLQVKQQPDRIFISQDKYVADILKKFDFWSIRTTTTPIESNKPLVKDEDSVDVDVHVYRSMIGSLMYLAASRPDIMFVVCACARFQVTPKASHLNVVKRIFSDYGGASLDRKSTTGGCQFLSRRLISWQCKKQTIVENFTTEAEYVAAANCCGQVLWIQNQMMDYGFNFMNTKIHIDNEITISVIKNPVAHSRTKLIEIRFHFIRDCYEKILIEVIKIHTDHNVADLLTKGFDVTRFKFLMVSIGLLNLEPLERDIDGTEELLLPDLFILWLTKVSTDSAKFVPLGKDSTAIKPLEKIPPRVKSTVIKMREAVTTNSSTPTPTTPTPTVFGDDETIAQVLIIMSQNKEKLKEKEKGVEIRNRIEEEDESDTESKGITEAEKKFKQHANDEEVARKVQEEWEAEEEKKMLAEEEATKAARSNEYDFIQKRLNADKILAEELQKEEREKFTIEQREKFLHDTIAAQWKFLAQQRSEAIRNKPPIRNQLRNQMMTYLKHVGGKKHSELKTKTFEEIQVLYERLKRQDQNFVAIGSAEDEREIKEMNKESKDLEKKILKKRVVNEEDTAKVPAKQEATEQGTKKRKSGHVKMIARKRPRPQPDDDSEDEHKKCLRITTFESTIDSEIMETKSFIARLHKVSSPDGNYLVIYRVNRHFREFNYLIDVLHIFDRHDLFYLYDLVMKQYLEITPEDFELILWGDLKIMMESSTKENDQELKDGTVNYMLVERRYPLSKELLQQMIDLGLEVEEESTAALQLGSQLTLLHSKELASPGSNSSVDLEPDEWIKDSGCSKHMTRNRKLFSTYKAYNGGNFIFGSSLRGNIIGKGTISNDSLKIDNVEHVDNLGFNLLSIGKICDNKCRVTFSEHDSEITKDGKVIGRGIRKKGLYVMKLGNKPKDQICLTTIDENSTLWHRRLGQANIRLIQSLVSKELVRNLLKLKFDQHFCDACKIGKQTYASHKAKNVVSTTRCLKLLHMDKTEAFDQFEIFSRKIQNQLGCSIVSIRTDHGREFDNEVQFGGFYNANGYSPNSKAYIILNKHTRKVEESLNVTFDETPPPSKTSPLVDTDLDEEEAIKVTKKKNLENYIVDETLEIDEIVNIKESKNHPMENVIGNLNQRTLRSQAQNQSNFFCFISTIEPKNVNEALGDESWIVIMQEELNQFVANDVWELVHQPRNMTIIGTKWVFRNKLDENGIVSRNKARLVAQGYNQQEGVDYDETYASVARLESIRILLAYACSLDFKLF
ncbi:retrovirus-related pol polyprotein from transposon TNT 1-94 [Tanacetum coccineum]